MISLKKAVALLLTVFSVLSSFSQGDSCQLKISLLTCGPGQDLYSIWGHTAIRVQIKEPRTDIIFNYGTFDFEDPDFYKKFTLGKLLYYVSAEEFRNFMYEYQAENRSVIEQVLNLSCEEKEKLFNALRINAQEANRYYMYQFFFDNCSTRPRDIIRNNSDDSVYFKRIIPNDPPTFRNMIHANLNQSKHFWSKFGIDLVLASRIDRKVTNEEAMFLPDYLMMGLDSSVVKNGSLVKSKQVILPGGSPEVESNTYLTPLVLTIALLLTGIALSLGKATWIKRVVNIFDIAYFLLLGLMGCFMLFMWFGTDHELCRDNYNLLWAMPTHLVMSFFVLKNTTLVRRYFAISALLSLVVLLSWRFLPQELNTAFLPLVILAGLRGAYRAMKK